MSDAMLVIGALVAVWLVLGAMYTAMEMVDPIYGDPTIDPEPGPLYACGEWCPLHGDAK